MLLQWIFSLAVCRAVSVLKADCRLLLQVGTVLSKEGLGGIYAIKWSGFFTGWVSFLFPTVSKYYVKQNAP